jgi:inorganic pyrophosphatase
MKKTLVDLECYDEEKEQWRCVVETPRGGRHKYKYEPGLNAFTLHRILPEGMSFPLDFGFLPHTQSEDGDPLDVLIVLEDPAFTGCVVPCRLIGVIEATQTEKDGKSERNDRLIALPVESRERDNVRSARELGKPFLSDVESFFIFYNEIFGKRFKVLGIRGPKTAERLAQSAMRHYRRHAKRMS